MKLRKAIKKVMALGTGATMLGATVLGAMAADLSDYPKGLGFIKDGKFDGLMVVGAKASTEDVLGVVDIATSLQFSSTTQTTISSTGAGSVSLSGDVAEIGKASDLLELNEKFGDVRETLTEFDLQMLASGTVTTDQGTTEYNQYLRFNETSDTELISPKVVFDENEYDEIADFMFIQDGDYIFEYELEFEEGFESEMETAAGAEVTCTDSTNAKLDDIEDEELHILGEIYSVVDTSLTTTGTHATSSNVKLELMAGDVSDTLKEHETKTYTIDGKDYEVTVLIISDQGSGDPTVKFKVNGEVTDEMDANGDSDTLSDGVEIGVREILANEGDEVGGEDIVEFFLGANKIELQDSNASDNAFDTSGVEISQENIEDAKVKITASCTSSTYEITDIKYRLAADAAKGDVYVPAGEGIREHLDEPEGMLGSIWDIKYEGLSDPGHSVFEISQSGDESFNLRFTNNNGQEYDIPYVDNSLDGDGVWKFGDDDDELWFEEINESRDVTAYVIKEDDMFILTDDRDETGVTHVLEYDSVDTANKEITFTDLATGSREMTYDGTITTVGNANGTIVVGGNTFTVWIYNTAGTTYNLAVDLDSDGQLLNKTQVPIVIQGGGIFNLTNSTATNLSAEPSAAYADTSNGQINATGALSTFKATLQTLASEFDESSAADELITIDIQTAANDEVTLDVRSPSLDSVSGEDVKKGMTNYGVYIEQTDEESSDANEVLINYPLAQRGVQAFVVGGSTTKSTSSTSSGVTSTSIERIEVGKSVLDTQVSSVTSDNLIIVGGPCVNTVAATLMNNPSPCYAGFEEGEGIIKLFENGEKVAMLVAGYGAVDTRRAAQVIANHEDYEGLLVGSEVVVSGTSLSDVTISAPVEKAEEPMDDETEGEGDDADEGTEE